MKKALFVSLILLMVLPITLVNGGINPPKTVDYGDIVSLDHIVYSDEEMLNVLVVEYEIIINVSVLTDWHNGLIGMEALSERAWLLNTPAKDCVHWVYIREIHEWYPVPPIPPEPFLDTVINGILAFASENLLGMIISGIVILYLGSNVLLQ